MTASKIRNKPPIFTDSKDQIRLNPRSIFGFVSESGTVLFSCAIGRAEAYEIEGA